MAAKLVLTIEAQDDVREAYAWYEQRRPGLGEDFLACVEACLERLCREPELFSKIHEDYRRSLIRRFPYAAFYEHNGDAVTVYAVFHTSRDPNKWRERIQ